MIELKTIQKVLEEKKDIVFSEEEKLEHYINWITFYRRNLDLFCEDILEIKLKPFQKQLLLLLAEGDINDIVASRGVGKR